MDSLKESLDERDNKEIPTKFILQLMDLILWFSIFSFNSEHFQQEIGAAMGSRPIPHYANNFMAKRNDKITRKLTSGTGNPLLLFKRFLDDLFSYSKGLWIHPTIKFNIKCARLELEPLDEKCNCPAKKSRIRETASLLTDADCSTNTMRGLGSDDVTCVGHIVS